MGHARALLFALGGKLEDSDIAYHEEIMRSTAATGSIPFRYKTILSSRFENKVREKGLSMADMMRSTKSSSEALNGK